MDTPLSDLSINPERLHFRPFSAADLEAIAALHAASWRTAYRGMLRDEYLAGPIDAERRAFWSARLLTPTPNQVGMAALRADTLIGFGFAYGDHDAIWGTLLDNLHVAPTARGAGVGTKLIHALMSALLAQGYAGPLYLWVYEANQRTRRLYERLGASAIERVVFDAPGGGTVAEWRYTWPSIAALRDTVAMGRG